MIEARADEPHHPDLEALLSPPPHNYTCIIRTRIRTHTLIHIIETAHRTPNQSPSHIPTSPRASESPWSRSSLNMHRDILARGGYIVFVEMIFIFQPDNHSSVLCFCVGFFSVVFVCVCVYTSCFSFLALTSPPPPPPFSLPPSVSQCLSVSSVTVWPLCKTGDDLVFGDVVHANDLSVKAAYSNMTA